MKTEKTLDTNTKKIPGYVPQTLNRQGTVNWNFILGKNEVISRSRKSYIEIIVVHKSKQK